MFASFIPDRVFCFPRETEWYLRCWIFHAVLFCILYPCISLGSLFDSGFIMRVVCVFPDLCSFLRRLYHPGKIAAVSNEYDKDTRQPKLDGELSKYKIDREKAPSTSTTSEKGT